MAERLAERSAERRGAGVLADAETARRRAEEAGSTLPPLLVAATRVAATVSQGVHGRRRVGAGESFWQFRQYQPGDTRSRIDWRKSAKSARLYIRETEWEAAQSLWLWRDGSPSMRYRSSDALPSKHERATLLLLALAALLVRGGEYVDLLGRDRIPYTGRTALTRLAEPLLRGGPEFDRGQVPVVRLPRYGRVVLFSDFLTPLAEVEQVVRAYGGGALQGNLVQVLDPAEEEFPFGGRTEFLGMEDEPRVVFDRAQSVRESYIDRLVEHRRGLADIARAVGWTFTTHRTDRTPASALLGLYEVLAHVRA